VLTVDTRQIVHRHFLMQDERPAHVEEVEIGAVEPFLRSLLFSDGTVTRALGVQTLAPVSIERLEQVEVWVPAEVAGHLEIDDDEGALRRRVGIGVDSAAPVIWAESHLIPERLPPGFLGLLDDAPHGIGQSLQRFALESYRELLWFGLATAPDWASSPWPDCLVLQRLYRIVSGRQAAILISESFAVQERAGVYHLAGRAAEQPAGGAG
jgi:chorismate-pyruvate lyase